MERQVILNSQHFGLTLNRLCYQLIETHNDFSDTVLIGLQPRGVNVLTRLKSKLESILESEVVCGNLDITFYRDDFRRRDEPLEATNTQIDFLIENKNVVLIDDVLFSGRSVRAGLTAIQSYGRPKNIELLVLIDRRFSRHLPIQPNYKGRQVDAIDKEKVIVHWKESHTKDGIYLENK